MKNIRKILALLVALTLMFTIVGCDGVGGKTTINDYSDEEIYDTFLEAYDFYMSWVYGQFYTDMDNAIMKEEGLFIAEVIHDEIKTTKQLVDKIHSYFLEPSASKFVAQINPYDENGKLYVDSIDGLGSPWYDFDTYSIERIDDKTAIITIKLKNWFSEEDETDWKTQIICKLEDGNLLFDYHKESPYYNDSDYVKNIIFVWDELEEF